MSNYVSRKARGTVEGESRRAPRDGQETRKKINKEVNLDFDPGDERARVTNTRGFKSWVSNREAGLTIESTVTVSVVCGQSTDEMAKAIHEAGLLAEQEAQKGVEDMGGYLNSFIEGT